MTQFIQAIYEQGVFRPLEPVALPEHERVSLTVAPADASGEVTQDAIKEKRAAALRSALADAARLPLEGPNDGFSGADHDQILYGWKK
ncbi:MAG: antitoxin family protein [Pirellulales bacterium]